MTSLYIFSYSITSINIQLLLITWVHYSMHISILFVSAPLSFWGLGKKILILPQKISPLNFSFVKYKSSTKVKRHEHLSNATLSIDSRPRPQRDWYESWLW